MASYAKPRLTRSLNAAVDLSAKQFYFVADNGSQLYNITGSSVGAFGAGFLMNCPEAGEACEVASVGGGAKGKAGATISGPDLALMANALGEMIPAASAGDIVVAMSREAAADEDVFEVEPIIAILHA